MLTYRMSEHKKETHPQKQMLLKYSRPPQALKIGKLSKKAK